MFKRVSIVNNGFYETVFDVDSGTIICKNVLSDDNDALSYLDDNGIVYTLVSYCCY